jgi:hypothetical protein
LLARRQWLTPVIIATQEADIRRKAVQSQPRQIVHKTLSQKTLSQKVGLVEWLKVKALSSSPPKKLLERSKLKFLKLFCRNNHGGCFFGENILATIHQDFSPLELHTRDAILK